MGKSDEILKRQSNERRKNNLLELKEMLSSQTPDKDFIKKVENYAERYDLPVSYVWDKLYMSDDDMELHGFEKDPGRQNIFELIQLDMVQAIPLIQGVEKLPSVGKKARYVINGDVVSLTPAEKAANDIKSIDFHWYYEFAGQRIDFYSTCKYTHEGGGAQDNQKSDVNFSFLREAKCSANKDVFFIAILDGEYYKQISKGGISKLEQINQDHAGPRCRATDMDNLKHLIRDVVIEWVNTMVDIDGCIRLDEIENIKKELT